MAAAELVMSHAPDDPASRMPAGGYVVACVTFYEQGFGVPSHQFLRSLLQFYCPELHHLTSSWIVHMAAFLTLCEAYKMIEPHFNLLLALIKHRFHVPISRVNV
jgi:hypothetical protein